MSHSIEYYQGMSTEQLIREMNHAHWTVDREPGPTWLVVNPKRH